MSEEQNVLLLTWVYVQACSYADDVDENMIKFRHTKVLAPNEEEAYTLGSRALPVEGWLEPQGFINDYVIPIYEQALTLEGSVQTSARIVLPMRKETSTQERGSGSRASPGDETDGKTGGK